MHVLPQATIKCNYWNGMYNKNDIFIAAILKRPVFPLALNNYCSNLFASAQEKQFSLVWSWVTLFLSLFFRMIGWGGGGVKMFLQSRCGALKNILAIPHISTPALALSASPNPNVCVCYLTYHQINLPEAKFPTSSADFLLHHAVIRHVARFKFFNE